MMRFATVLLIAAAPALAGAQPVPCLDTIHPIGFQAGTGTHARLTGANLSNVTELLVSNAGTEPMDARAVECVPAEGGHGGYSVWIGGEGVRAEAGGADEMRIVVNAAKDAPAGPCEVRVATPWGVSNPVTVYIGDLPEIRESEPTNGEDAPQNLSLPATVNGTVASKDDTDTFQFEAKRGQRLIFEVQASRIGSPLDSYLVLRGPDGGELVTNGMRHGFDAEIDYTAERDGLYTLSIRDLRYRGGGDYFYRLHMGELPRLDRIFPLGGRLGEATRLKAEGRNLRWPGELTIAADPDAPEGIRQIRMVSPAGLRSNALPFQLDAFPNLMEKEAGNPAGFEAEFAVPAAINGVIGAEGDSDRFKFKAEPGDTFRFEVFAQRLGSPLDSVLSLTDAEGNGIETADDGAGSEAVLQHHFVEGGDYILSIRDLVDRGGAEYAYRLRAERPAPGFSLTLGPDNPRVFCGGSAPLQAQIVRMNGFNGAVKLEIDGLPKGFRIEPSLVPAGQSQALIALTAPPDAESAIHELRIAGIGASGPERLKRAAAGGPLRLTVMDAPPFLLEPVTLDASVVQGERTRVYVKARRLDGFEGPIVLEAVGLPNGVSADTPTIAPGEDTAAVALAAAGNAETGARSIAVAGRMERMGQTWVQTAAAVTLRVDEAPFMLDLEPKRFILPLPAGGEAERTEEVELAVTLDRRGVFTGPVELVPVNAPEGFDLAGAVIGDHENEITIRFSASGGLKADSYSFHFMGKTAVNRVSFERRTPGVEVKLIEAQSIAESE